MALSFWLAAALVGPQTAPATFTEAAARAELAQWSAPQWREAYRRVMQASAEQQRPDPAEVVPDLAGLYVALDDAAVLGSSERSSLRHRVKFRLEQIRDDLLRAQVRVRRPRTNVSAKGGAAVPPGAAQLIQLIQTTIEPDSWAINGGRGTITYFAPLQVLVIRQTGEVHHQIGGTLGALRQ
jgi:hypothetical protein